MLRHRFAAAGAQAPRRAPQHRLGITTVHGGGSVSPAASVAASCHGVAPMARCGARSHRLRVVCMAHPRRVAKVASQIQREISTMFVTDPVLVKAVTPERASGLQELSAIASVTHVYVSNDLQVVKVYVSIYSDERGKQQAMGRLKRLEGYVRTAMGQRVPLRLTPEYRFEYDDSIEEAELVERVIGQEDVARFTAELEAEQSARAGSGQVGVLAAADAGSADPGLPTFGDEDDEDDAGFFDAAVLQGQGSGPATTGPADQKGDSTQRSGGQDRGEPQQPSQPRKKFVVYRTTDVLNHPGPFDDLFGDPTPQPRRGKGKKGGRGSGQGGWELRRPATSAQPSGGQQDS